MDKLLKDVMAMIEDEKTIAVRSALLDLAGDVKQLKNTRHIVEHGVMYISEADVMQLILERGKEKQNA